MQFHVTVSAAIEPVLCLYHLEAHAAAHFPFGPHNKRRRSLKAAPAAATGYRIAARVGSAVKADPCRDGLISIGLSSH